MKKNFVAILLVLVMALCMAVPAFAAGISDGEQALLDEFCAGREIAGVQVTPPAKYVNISTNELMRRDFTEAEITDIRTVMNECYDILEAEEVTTFEQMKASPRLQEIVDKVAALATSLGYTFNFNYDNGDVVINQTGFNTTATIIIVASLVVVLAAAIVIVSRKRLLAK